MLRDFYGAVLPSQGHYALFDGPRKRHIWASDLDELTQQTESLADRPDIYFATASFREPGSRTTENALYRRAFCFDIDAGEAKYEKHGDKVYRSQQDAIAGLLAWVQVSRIGPSWVVSSGAGLHAYFTLTADVEVADWLPVAHALKAMALAQGLRIDPAVTGDAARVLRPLGALHRSGARVAVLFHEARSYSLERLAAETAGHAHAPPRREKSANALFLDAPIGPPRTLAKVVQHCAAMRQAVAARGDVAEPYWRAMLGVIKFTVEGAEAAHAASEGHPDYDYNATQQKFDRWTAGPSTCTLFEQENPEACAGCKFRGRVKSPILLGELNDEEVAANPEVVQAAAPQPTPAEPEAWSVVDDAEPLPVRDPWAGSLPEGFRVVQTPGGYMLVVKRQIKVDDETDPEHKKTVTVDAQFSGVPFWFESWAVGSDDTDPALATYCVYNAARRTVSRHTMPTRAAANRDSMLGALAAQNVQVYPSNPTTKQLMEDYVKASLERIRSASQRQKIADRFGTMHNEKGQVVVAHGRYLIHPDGTVLEGVTQERLRPRSQAYTLPLPESDAGRWEPEVWASHILPRARRHVEYLREFYSDPNFRPYQLAIMLAWASPMMAFMQGGFHPGTPLPGVGLTVSLYSPKSGIGKTAAMSAAALAFGPPSAVVMQLDRMTATDNARQALLAQSGTLPCFMDEMEDVEARDLASLISTAGNGAPKKRLTKELAITGGTATALINVMSTNKSHRELAAADRNESPATQMRLLEIECSHVQPVDQDRRTAEAKARSGLHDCAGAVGGVIHLAMCSLGSAALNELGLKCADRAARLVEGRQDGRFMWRALGAMLAVRAMLKRVGLEVFDDDELVDEFQRWHDAGYDFANDRLTPSDGPSQIAVMLGDLAAKTLVTFTVTDRRGKRDETRYDNPLSDHMPSEVVARSVLDQHIISVKVDAVREWAFKKRVSYQGLIRAAREADLFEPDRKGSLTPRIDLFQGTRLAQGVRVPVLRVRVDRLDPAAVESLDAQVGDNVHELRPRVTPGQTASAPRSAGPAEG